MKLIGIDPGKKGSIVEIDTEEKTARYMALPYWENKLLDYSELNLHFNLSSADYIYCEEVGPMKIWGITNNWAFAFNYSAVLHWLQGHPFQLVRPKRWQADAHKGIGKDFGTAKEKSALAFSRLCPSFGKIAKGDDGIIDAFFIAKYAGIDNNVRIPHDLLFIECV